MMTRPSRTSPVSRGLRAACLTLAAALVPPLAAFAQPGPGGPPAPGAPWEEDEAFEGPGDPAGRGGPPPARRAAIHAQMEKRQRALLIELVGLSADKADALVALRDKHQRARRPLRKKARAARRSLEQLSRDDKASDAELAAAVDALLAARRALRDAQDAEIKAMRGTLSAREQARLLVAMPELHRRARAHVRDARRRHLRRELERLDGEAELEEREGRGRREHRRPPRRR